MMLSSQSSCSTLLALSFLFSKAQGAREVIAYRTVSNAEAELINKNEKPHYIDEEEFSFTYPQLGTGYYTSNKPTQWRAIRGEWYCVIEADSEKLKEISKVWIPHTVPDKEEELWYDADELSKYIESVVSKDPENALRFSYVAKLESELQMNIPYEVIEDNDVLDLSAQCWKTAKELEGFEIVDWRKWEIIGAPAPEPEPES
ncbi:hypothetical protein LZ554_001861 [Drepanopeziza brunnea f. sp. 'monogermtubi']|nr:hypothetical protein LZ554_001861 [Drepanopeziza brunnea f. sp. 'monogermtubi']